MCVVLAGAALYQCGPRTGTIACEGAVANIITVVLDVVVRDAQGQALCGATVATLGADGGKGYALYPEPAGSSEPCDFGVGVDPGTYTVLVSNPRYASVSKTVVVPPCSVTVTADVVLVALRDGGASD